MLETGNCDFRVTSVLNEMSSLSQEKNVFKKSKTKTKVCFPQN